MTTPLPAGWETQVLEGIGAPVNQQNIANLDQWQRAEGGSTNNVDSYNPFNTTLGRFGGTSTNAPGVKAFGSWSQGLQATIATIEQPNMQAIDNALKGSAPSASFDAAVNSSPWGTHLGAQSATLTGLFGNPFPGGSSNPFNDGALGGLSAIGGNVISDAIKQFVQSGLVLRGTLIVVGLVILFIGLRSLFDGNSGPGEVAGSGVQSVTVHVKQAAKKTAEAGTEAAAA